jgi:hypothetical protein
MEGRRRDGVKKGTQQCPSMSKNVFTNPLTSSVDLTILDFY